LYFVFFVPSVVLTKIRNDCAVSLVPWPLRLPKVFLLVTLMVSKSARRGEWRVAE
jgi:hypothetical protein